MSEENQELLAAQAHAAHNEETAKYMAGRLGELARSGGTLRGTVSGSVDGLEVESFDLNEGYAQLGRIDASLRGSLGRTPPAPASPAPAPAPAPPPTLRASAAPAPAPASPLASRDYANLTNFERMQLAEEDPEAFAKNRAEWESRGAPNARAGIPIQNSGYEHWTNQERMTCAATDPDRFESARKDWIARGEPIVDEGPEAA